MGVVILRLEQSTFSGIEQYSCPSGSGSKLIPQFSRPCGHTAKKVNQPKIVIVEGLLLGAEGQSWVGPRGVQQKAPLMAPAVYTPFPERKEEE